MFHHKTETYVMLPTIITMSWFLSYRNVIIGSKENIKLISRALLSAYINAITSPIAVKIVNETSLLLS
jgi:hypothetical protein